MIIEQNSSSINNNGTAANVPKPQDQDGGNRPFLG